MTTRLGVSGRILVSHTFFKNLKHPFQHIQKSAKSKNVYNCLKNPEVELPRWQNRISVEPYSFCNVLASHYFKLKYDSSIGLLYINGKPLKSPFGIWPQNLDPEKNGSGKPVWPVQLLYGYSLHFFYNITCFFVKNEVNSQVSNANISICRTHWNIKHTQN